jgi:hypothetical protein
MDLHPGQTLGRYEIVSWLAAGGMGTDYRAHDPRMNRMIENLAFESELRLQRRTGFCNLRQTRRRVRKVLEEEGEFSPGLVLSPPALR